MDCCLGWDVNVHAAARVVQDDVLEFIERVTVALLTTIRTHTRYIAYGSLPTALPGFPSPQM